MRTKTFNITTGYRIFWNGETAYLPNEDSLLRFINSTDDGIRLGVTKVTLYGDGNDWYTMKAYKVAFNEQVDI